MISREDMLELTRRMTPARTSITRIAGCYVDRDGEFDGSFNTNFLKLSGSDKARNLKLAKAVPFSDTNQNLIKYEFSAEAQKPQRRPEPCECISEKSGQAAQGAGGRDSWGGVKKGGKNGSEKIYLDKGTGTL